MSFLSKIATLFSVVIFLFITHLHTDKLLKDILLKFLFYNFGERAREESWGRDRGRRRGRRTGGEQEGEKERGR